ncbi:metalloproteinase inhibitor 2 [Oncorhynchus mykiss]|uniref:metalloproteinase inhibitor 2 n=1 Tax=Oncorhynchus mykiss TaxID=8022 RepID=UPI000B4F35F6|nr:metalloproteinase inhibitor 2 [Oncorhynchus mykiss]
MTWSVSSCFITLVVLFLWRVDDITEACTCMSVHPQRAFCNADVVIRAKVVGVKAVSGNTNYDVKQIEMFKGPNQDIHVISTGGPCRAFLEINKEYLFTGRLNTDGTVHVIMCDFIQSWGALSDTQMRSLTLRYRSGCDCTIIRCTSLPCPISTADECLWMDIGQSRPWDNNIACIKGGDGSCAWYKGMALPK